MILAQMGGMQFSWDFNTATLVAITAQIVLLVAYLVKTNGKANAAFKMAEDAKKDAKDVGVQLGALAGNLALLREQVARDHPDHDTLGEVEKRLTGEIHHIRDRIDEYMRGQSGHRR